MSPHVYEADRPAKGLPTVDCGFAMAADGDGAPFVIQDRHHRFWISRPRLVPAQHVNGEFTVAPDVISFDLWHDHPYFWHLYNRLSRGEQQAYLFSQPDAENLRGCIPVAYEHGICRVRTQWTRACRKDEGG